MHERKKSVPLQPLSRGRAAEDDRLSEALGYGRECRMLHRVSYLADVQGSEKGQAARLLRTFRKFFQKNFRKNLEVTKKRLTFANAFPLKREHERKDSSLKDFG